MSEGSSLHDIQEKNFLSAFGERAHIYYRHYYPKKKLPKKIIHIIFQHGMIEYHKRHQDLFDVLREHYGKRLVISCMDLIGHGLSGGHRAHLNDFNVLVKDMTKFFELCHDELYEKHEVQTVLISHSLGGLVTLRTLTQEQVDLPFKIDALVFSNPCIGPKITLPRGVVNLVDGLPETMVKMRVPLIYDAYDLSHDKEKAISFMHDYLISKAITIKFGLETLNATKYINSLSYFFKTPSFFILSGDDRLVDVEKTQLFITGMDKQIVKVKYYPNMRHDILNETCRKEVFQEIIGYIDESVRI